MPSHPSHIFEDGHEQINIIFAVRIGSTKSLKNSSSLGLKDGTHLISSKTLHCIVHIFKISIETLSIGGGMIVRESHYLV